MIKLILLLLIAVSSYGQDNKIYRGTEVAPVRARTALAADVANSTVALQDVTGLSFDVQAGQRYSFYFVIYYDAAATTTGSRWVITGPNFTWLRYNSSYTLTATGIPTINNGLTAYNLPAGANATSVLANNKCILEGMILPNASGTVQLRFASEVANSAITAKSGSYVTFEPY